MYVRIQCNLHVAAASLSGSTKGPRPEYLYKLVCCDPSVRQFLRYNFLLYTMTLQYDTDTLKRLLYLVYDNC